MNLIKKKVSQSARYINFPFSKRYDEFFINHETVFNLISERLNKCNYAVLSGLGGVGKTSVAIEYANRNLDKYKNILWMSANSENFIKSSFDEIAKYLSGDFDKYLLQTKNYQEKNINIVKFWLRNNKDWLLIVDDIESVAILSNYFSFDMTGHILVTSREPTTGCILVDLLSLENSISFLIKRSGIPSNEINFSCAEKLCIEMDRLPLALEQAGAYIYRSRCGLVNYLKYFMEAETKKIELLNRGIYSDSWYRGSVVAKTWAISIKKVQQSMPIASDILIICAFLYFEIPEEIIKDGAKYFGSEIELLVNDFVSYNDCLERLINFSLIKRNSDTEKIIIHKLLQDVLRSEMNKDVQLEKIEQIIKALNQIFPDVEFSNWDKCDRLFKQVQSIVDQIKHLKINKLESIQLLNKAGIYLFKRARFTEAKDLFEYILSITELSKSSDFARAANSLAELLESEGLYEQSLIYANKAYRIWQDLYGIESLEVSDGEKTLGMIFESIGKVSEAKNFFENSLRTRKNILGEEDIKVAEIYNYLGKIYSAKLEFVKSIEFHNKAKLIREKKLVTNHPDIAETYNNIASVYTKIRNYDDAEELYKKALNILENIKNESSNYSDNTNKKHPIITFALGNLAFCNMVQNKYLEAENLYREAISILEINYGKKHPDLATFIDNLAVLYYLKEQYDEAIKLHMRALKIRKDVYGNEDLNVAVTLSNLGFASLRNKDYQKAQSYLQEAFEIRNKLLGDKHFESIVSLAYLALSTKKVGSIEESKSQFGKALEVSIDIYGENSDETYKIINIYKLNC